MKDGIVVERMLGAGRGNVLAGDFNSNVLLGYLVTIGNEARWLDGGFQTPAIYCDGVSVSSKK